MNFSNSPIVIFLFLITYFQFGTDFDNVYVYVCIIYRKIPNTSPGLKAIPKHIWGAYIFWGAYIRRAFCVSILVSRLVKSIIISLKYWHFWQKLSFFKQNSPLFCFKIYLNQSWHLFMLWLSTHLPVLERLMG